MNKTTTEAAPGGAAQAASGTGLDRFLTPTYYLDFDTETVRAYAEAKVGKATSPVDRAVRLYYAVRDDIRYDPYAMDMRPETFRASYCLAQGRGFCIQKGVVLAAAARAAGIPARLGFADVRNHLATPRLLDLLETDVFIFHGYVEMWVDGRWVKATPAFNLSLCEKFRVHPLEFDGRHDSLFHPFDAEGRRHMEYVNDRGTFADLPYEEIDQAFKAKYPKYFARLGEARGDFEAEAAAEGGTAESAAAEDRAAE